jgi:ribonuclease HI
MQNKENKIIIFTDGASKGNPGPGGYGAVVVLPEGKVIELGGGEKKTTNNRMELTGAVEALSHLPLSDEGGLREVEVYTDSKYLINGVTGWIYGWQKNGWKTKEKKEVLNKDIWEKLAELIKDRKIKWNYVGGHVGVAGNERCDEIASGFATGEKVDLYVGTLSKYSIKVLDLGHSEEKKEIKYNKSAKAYSYLSLVSGILNIDKTWAECEKRVKGKSGVKYKKAISAEQEKEIIRSWGLHD